MDEKLFGTMGRADAIDAGGSRHMAFGDGAGGTRPASSADYAAVKLEKGNQVYGGAPTIQVVQGGESHLSAAEVRSVFVGPGVNQPDPFPGYTSFVGWDAPVRLANGTMYVAFNAGYWHASPNTPLPEDSTLRYWYNPPYNMPLVDAPTGGRAMITKSTDNGVTWSKPVTLIDTPYDDRSPAITELSDGTLLCVFFTMANTEIDSMEIDPSKGGRTGVVRSFDGGQTWEQTPIRMPAGYLQSAPECAALELTDGSVFLVDYAKDPSTLRYEVRMLRSTDKGATWSKVSEVKAGHNLYEPSVAQLHDGALVMIARNEGDISWSLDNGNTWTDPVTFGMRMFAPSLLTLDDGTLLCTFGSYATKRLEAIFSTDGGRTWIAPAADHGFLVDTAYGYSQSCLMPDGSAYLTYQANCGYTAEELANEAIFSLRLSVREDHSGIELLPVTVGISTLPGDANADGVVNDLDAAILARNWLASGAGWAMGDFNGDGIVNDLDATILAVNWQTTAAVSEPEPSTAALILGGLLFLKKAACIDFHKPGK